MAIPVEKLIRLLNGRVIAINTQPAVIEEGQIRLPVRLTIRDPLLKIKNLQVEHWVGTISTSGASRPADLSKFAVRVRRIKNPRADAPRLASLTGASPTQLPCLQTNTSLNFMTLCIFPQDFLGAFS